MSLPVRWLPEAEAELMAAAVRYEGIRPGLGVRFLGTVDEAIETAAKSPLIFAILRNGRRRVVLHKFPYGIFFVVKEPEIVVVACLHGKRNPRHWQLR